MAQKPVLSEEMFECNERVLDGRAALRESSLEELVLSTLPPTLFPDANTTTYQIVELPNGEIVHVPTLDYGSRLLRALIAAHDSIYHDSDAVALNLMTMKTMAGDPAGYVLHLTSGFLETVRGELVELPLFLWNAAELLFKGAVCLLDDYAAYVEEFVAWSTGEISMPVFPLTHPYCEPLYKGISGLGSAGSRLMDVSQKLSSPETAIDLLTGSLAAFYEFVAALRLGARMKALNGDAKRLGAMQGAVIGFLAVSWANPEGRALDAVRAAGWLKIAEKASDAVVRAADAASDVRPIAGELPATLDADAVREAMKEVGGASRKLVREADATRFPVISSDEIVRFGELIGRVDLNVALDAIYSTLPKAVNLVFWIEPVKPFNQLARELKHINESSKLLILVESAASSTDPGDALRIAKRRAEEELFEAAHVWDDELHNAAQYPPLTADWVRLGFANGKAMPAFAAVRLEHRTTLDRLRRFDAAVPELTKTDITNEMRAVKGAITKTTRGYEVIRKFGAVYESRFPMVFDRIRQTHFEHYRTLIDEFREADPQKWRKLVDDWPSFRAWLEV